VHAPAAAPESRLQQSKFFLVYLKRHHTARAPKPLLNGSFQRRLLKVEIILDYVLHTEAVLPEQLEPIDNQLRPFKKEELKVQTKLTVPQTMMP
jgi:hypothetical protein